MLMRPAIPVAPQKARMPNHMGGGEVTRESQTMMANVVQKAVQKGQPRGGRLFNAAGSQCWARTRTNEARPPDASPRKTT